MVGKTFEDHISGSKEVSSFSKRSAVPGSHYFGFSSVDQQKVKAVEEWPILRDKYELKSFLILCTYYRRFVPGFANIANPMNKLMEGEMRFQWDGNCNCWSNNSKVH